MVLALFFALFFLLGCTQAERDNPLDPDGVNYAGAVGESSSSSGVDLVFCSVGDACLQVAQDICDASPGGQIVAACSPGSSSSQSESSVYCQVGSSCALVPLSYCSILQGTPVLECESSPGSSSSSSVGGGGSSSSVDGSSSTSSVFVGMSGTFIDLRDSKTYNWVRIGSQIWMAENLNYDVPDNTTDVCYDNNSSNCTTYGKLYNWATAMNLNSSCNSSTCSGQVQTKHRGICPTGWHVPSDAEWDVLVKYVDPNWTSNFSGGNIAGTKLKAVSGWNTGSGYIAGADNYGFSALPGGYGRSNGGFRIVTDGGNWWSASENNSSSAYYRGMGYNYEIAFGDYVDKPYLVSVRCVQD